jgi:hypothetical protein
MKKTHIAFLIGTLIGAATAPVSLFANQAAKTAKTTTPAAGAPTAAQIADAKAKGMVWCNPNSKVYHMSTDKYYGTTKRGSFMTEADAKAAGYKLAGTGAAGKKKTTSK